MLTVYTTRGVRNNVEVLNWSAKYPNKAVTYRIQLECLEFHLSSYKTKNKTVLGILSTLEITIIKLGIAASSKYIGF